MRHRYNYVGLENIPSSKGVLLLGNHVSWVDWIIVQLPLQKRINYMMDKDIYYWPLLHSAFKLGETIPVSTKASKDAFVEAHKRLLGGKIVGLYPEGEISKDGELGKFYRGYEMIPQNYDGVIVPFFIEGIYGSMFAKYKPKKRRNIFRRRKINVYFAPPVPMDTKADEIRDIILAMKEKYETK